MTPNLSFHRTRLRRSGELVRWAAVIVADNHAFRKTFTTVAVVEGIRLLLPSDPTIDMVVFSIGYVMLGAFGYLATRDGHGYKYVFSRTWLFIALWFSIGALKALITFLGLAPAEIPPEKNFQAFMGYVFATLLFAPIAFASSWLGILVYRLFTKFRHRSSNAA